MAEIGQFDARILADAKGAVFIDQRLVHSDALESELRHLAQTVDPSVQLHADATVPYGRVAQVLAVVQRAGIEKLAMVTVAQ